MILMKINSLKTHLNGIFSVFDKITKFVKQNTNCGYINNLKRKKLKQGVGFLPEFLVEFLSANFPKRFQLKLFWMSHFCHPGLL